MTPYSREYVERIEAEYRAIREEFDAAEKQLAEADARLASLELAAQPDGPPTEPPSGWRDIASAPKDGTAVDVWLQYSQHGHATGGRRVPAADYVRDGWLDDEGNPLEWEDPLGQAAIVTHWMPQPAPPTEAGADYLNTPPRSAETMALSIALRALALIGRTSRDEGAREAADKALADSAALAPRAGDAP